MNKRALTLMPRREGYLLALLLGACSLAAVADATGVLTNLNTEQNLQQMMLKDVHAEAQKNVNQLFRAGQALGTSDSGRSTEPAAQLSELGPAGGDSKLAR